MNSLRQDVLYTLRQMRKSPGFTVVAVLTLALGIGANTAIFSVMNALLLRNLPVPHPEQLVYLQTHGMPREAFETGNPLYTFSLTTFERFRVDKRTFSDVVGFVPLGANAIPVRINNAAETATGDMVSGNFFSGLGIRPALGQIFSDDDERRHTENVVLNYSYWVRRFNRDPNVIGQTIYIQSVPFTVTGVAARDFPGVEPGTNRTDFWIPFQNDPRIKAWGGENLYYSPNKWWFLMMVGRLKPGLSWQTAIAQANTTFQSAAYEGMSAPKKGDSLPRLSFAATGGLKKFRENYDNPFAILMAMVGFILLIACVNVAMLLLARNAARQREFSVRIALGAGWTNLFRQLFAEALLLIAIGTALAWVFALGATSALAAWAELEIRISPDRTVLFFTLAIALAVSLLLGLAPLRRTLNAPVGLALKTSNSSAQGTKSSRMGQIALACQVALCLMLLVGAGLLIRTLRNLQTTDLGFHPSGLLVFGIKQPQSLQSSEQVMSFLQSVTDRVKGLPGVESATIMGNRIGSGWSNNTNVSVDGVRPQGNKGSMVRWNNVGADYCHVLGIRVLEGRDFRESDSATAPGVAIVNQTFANWYLPGTNPVGHQIQISRTKLLTIVGVVADSKYTGVSEDPTPMAYVPVAQEPGGTTKTIVVRTSGNALALLPELRRAMASFGPDMPLLRPMTQESQLAESYITESLFARIAMFFGLLAAVLVATGLYGTLAYKVSRRTADIGVRMALGARPSGVLWMVIRESLAISVAGIVIGLPVALFASRVLATMLYKLSPFDPASFAAAAGCILAVASAAAYIPARRAAKVDPMVALRYE